MKLACITVALLVLAAAHGVDAQNTSQNAKEELNGCDSFTRGDCFGLCSWSAGKSVCEVATGLVCPRCDCPISESCPPDLEQNAFTDARGCLVISCTPKCPIPEPCPPDMERNAFTDANGCLVISCTPKAPTLSDPSWSCQAGQGGDAPNQGFAVKGGNFSNEQDCAAACLAKSGCIAFDYTATVLRDSCRFFNNKNRPGNGGTHDRRYCTARAFCQVGQGGDAPNQGFAMKDFNNEENCAAACLAESSCFAFDYTTTLLRDSCRLFNTDKNRPGNGGSHDRRYCMVGPPTLV
jgi:hypothetical protein